MAALASTELDVLVGRRRLVGAGTAWTRDADCRSAWSKAPRLGSGTPRAVRRSSLHGGIEFLKCSTSSGA